MTDPADAAHRQLQQLFADHHDRILGYLLRRVGNRDDARDLVAETFVVAWRRLTDVPAGSEALPWLYAVARRLLANHRRSEHRRIALADRLRDEPFDQGGLSSDPEGKAIATQAWRELSDQDRELLSLTAWEGLDTAQIAVVLGCSRNAVRIRLHRARGRFERLLSAADDAPLATPHFAALKEERS
jgi:RNA polymerase sigma factor (sigma-70 family)